MKKLDRFTLNLQIDRAQLSEGRYLFDCVIEIMPELSDRLAKDADIVECVSFGTAIVKMQ